MYPSPYIRSLSLDSNLFNKINSLRIYGAGRLQDFMYNTKIKNLIKNQINYNSSESSTENTSKYKKIIAKLSTFDENNIKHKIMEIGKYANKPVHKNIIVDPNNLKIKNIGQNTINNISSNKINILERGQKINSIKKNKTIFKSKFEYYNDRDITAETEVDHDGHNAYIKSIENLENYKNMNSIGILLNNNHIGDFNIIGNGGNNVNLFNNLNYLENYKNLNELQYKNKNKLKKNIQNSLSKRD
jgi:hypothetical protein